MPESDSTIYNTPRLLVLYHACLVTKFCQVEKHLQTRGGPKFNIWIHVVTACMCTNTDISHVLNAI